MIRYTITYQHTAGSNTLSDLTWTEFLMALNRIDEDSNILQNTVKCSCRGNYIGKKTNIGHYYTTDAVYGVLTELGSPNLNVKKHICVDGLPYRVYITKEQDLELKKYYGTQKLRVEILQKRSSYDGHIITSELESFVPISGKNLIDSLADEGYIDFELIKETNSIEDILNRIYANR